MKIYRANLYRLLLNSVKIGLTVVFFISIVLYLIYSGMTLEGDLLYQVYITMVTFFSVMYFLIQNGELFEKNIIRYYAEAQKKRHHIILSLYLDNVMLYMVSVTIILGVLGVLGIQVTLNLIVSYFLLYLLYLLLAMNLLLVIKKTSVCIILSILFMWVAPNLANLAFSDTWLFEFQPGYYLSPDTLLRAPQETKHLITYVAYASGLVLTSIIVFEKSEL